MAEMISVVVSDGGNKAANLKVLGKLKAKGTRVETMLNFYFFPSLNLYLSETLKKNVGILIDENT